MPPRSTHSVDYCLLHGLLASFSSLESASKATGGWIKSQSLIFGPNLKYFELFQKHATNLSDCSPIYPLPSKSFCIYYCLRSCSWAKAFIASS